MRNPFKAKKATKCDILLPVSAVKRTVGSLKLFPNCGMEGGI